MRTTALLTASLMLVGFAACAPVRPSEARMVAAPPAPGGDWFKQTGCTDCHSVSAYKIWNVAAVGPDLSLAVEDVPQRFGRTLEDFLHAPTGTMAMVLSTRIPLSPEQRDEAIEKLQAAYRRHQGLPDPIEPVKSH
jgi:hypothetical protein